MEAEFLTSIIQQIEELQGIHEKETKALSDVRIQRQEMQQRRKQAESVVLQRKSTLTTTIATSIAKKKELISCNTELSNLAIEFQKAEAENERLLHEKQMAESILLKLREAMEKLREAEQQRTVARKGYITLTPEFARKETLITEHERLLARIEDLRKQEPEWRQISEDLNNFHEAQAQITEYNTRLAKKVQDKETVVNEDMQHAANLWRYLFQWEEGIAMGKEDLRATNIAHAELEARAAEVERDIENLQKM